MGALLNASLGDRYRAAVERAAGGDPDLSRLLADPNALLQPTLRDRIPDGAYAEIAGSLAGALTPAFWTIFALGVAAFAVAALFPRGRAKDFVNREEMP